MANENSDQHYTYSKLEKFRGCERKFRTLQSMLLLFMVICFIFYIITFGIDIAKFLDDLPLLAAALTILIVAMIFLAIGIRGVAFENFCLVLIFVIAFFLIIIAHAVSFLFRHPGLTAVNLTLAILLFIGGIIYLCFLCRLSRLKPPNYGVSRELKSEDTESSIALTSPERSESEKINVVNVEKRFTNLGRDIEDGLDLEPKQIKREAINLKSGIENDYKNIKQDFQKLKNSPEGNIEKEFVAIKRVLLNESKKELDNLNEGVEKELGKLKTNIDNLGDNVRINFDNVKSGIGNVQREYTMIKREISDDLDRFKDNVKVRYGDIEKELGTSFKSGLQNIDREFNIFQREFGGSVLPKISPTQFRSNIEEFKSGGENVKREIIEIKRDEAGNITSYVERRLTDSGVEIQSVTVDKGRAPIANFSNT
ncbi:hypothetical protein NH340_JMT00098 [Sarcoptes scabiei]|nr:hypothetical protein NH340_JMT00098 [Sarcoptes scabiei]